MTRILKGSKKCTRCGAIYMPPAVCGQCGEDMERRYSFTAVYIRDEVKGMFRLPLRAANRLKAFDYIILYLRNNRIDDVKAIRIEEG
jgi:uncharacterized OB-fold protein